MRIVSLLFVLVAALPAPGALAAASATDIPAGKLSSDVQPLHYRLDLDIDPATDGFSGVVEIDVEIRKPSGVIYLHGNNLAVSSTTLTTPDGAAHTATYEQVDPTGVARLTFADTLPAGRATLRFAYTAKFGRGGESLYQSIVGDDSYVFTQFQPIDARRMFPGFDEPGFKTPFDVAVTTPSANVVIGNAPVQDEAPAGDGRKRVSLATTLPLPTYLIALAVGPLDVVEAPPLPANAVRQRPLPLRGVATRGKGPRLRYALDNTATIISYLENYFGVAFPYPKLDLIASPDFGGGMENAGAIIYGEARLLVPDDASFEQLRQFGGIHAHEVAHQWFGDLVTPKWWDDIWLNESFASWMSFKAGNAWQPSLRFDIVPALQTPAAMELDSRIAARQIRQPVTRNPDIGSAFDGITYLKGSAVLGMFESWLGEERFRAGIRTHVQRFPHGVADVEDFMASLARGSGRPDLVPAFRSFIDQPGVPLVTARLKCSAEGPELEVAQSRYLPVGSQGDPRRSWQLPLCVRYGTSAGTGKDCALLTDVSTRIPLQTRDCPSFVMPNADGAGYYRFALDDAGWRALQANFGELNELEALLAADSLSAAYQANRLTTDAWLAAIGTLATSKYPSVVMSPGASLVRLRDYLAPAAAREQVAGFMRATYRPRLAALDASERPARDDAATDATAVDRALLRTKLVSFLALEARDPELRATLAGQAGRYIGFGKPGATPDPGAVTPAQVDIALQVGVQEGGLPFIETLIRRMLASGDIQFRSQAALALGSTDDPAAGTRVRKLLLDPQLRAREPTTIAFALAARASQRRATFDWFKANHEAFIGRIGHFGYRWLPRFGAGFCTLPEREELKAFFTPMLDKLDGADRTLAETLEGIELCAALAEAKRDEVGQYFSTSGNHRT
ncbi:MAG: M1 family metallopeptidase [Gammaproteobacteria bacterium]|nr:M1 family metallopeptidase [Gammaproteobacteria bacterium]